MTYKRTPTSERGLRAYDHLTPTEAIYLAWNTEGPQKFWHAQMRAEVRRNMPLLARALDRMEPGDTLKKTR